MDTYIRLNRSIPEYARFKPGPVELVVDSEFFAQILKESPVADKLFKKIQEEQQVLYFITEKPEAKHLKLVLKGKEVIVYEGEKLPKGAIWLKLHESF